MSIFGLVIDSHKNVYNVLATNAGEKVVLYLIEIFTLILKYLLHLHCERL